MANVTFWKGTFEKYQEKVTASSLVDGRLYFIEDAANPTTLGSLYLKNVLISPQRLTALALDTTDNVSTVTAKAVVDFVKAQFADGSAYATKIAEIEGRLDVLEGYFGGEDGVDGRLDAIEGRMDAAEGRLDAAEGRLDGVEDRLDVVEPKVTAVEAILAGFGGEDEPANVKTYVDEVKAIASAAMEFKGVKDSVSDLPETAENGDIYYVKADDTEYVYIADKEVTEGDSKWEALGGYVKADVYTKDEVDSLLTGKVDKTTKVNGKALSGDITLVADDIDDVYSMTEVDGAIDADVAAAKAIIDAYTVGGVAISANPTLESMGVTSAITTAKGEAIAAAEAMTVNGVAFTDGAAVITAGDIMTEAGGTTTVSAELGRLDDAIKAITGGGEEGDATTTIAGLAVQVSEIKGYTVNGKKISENPVLVASDIEDVYSKTEVDNAISNAALVWIED